MKLHYEKADDKNRSALEALEVFPEQIHFIEPAADCLKEADEDERWNPVGIYDGEVLVGFSMYGRFGKKVWLDRILIDKAFQGRGYGKEAVEELSMILKEKYQTDSIYLSVYDDNPHAIALYKKEGFSFNGELDENGEKVMVRRV